MKFYFSLQFKRLFRSIKEAGFNPVLVLIIGCVGFVVFSYLFFQRIDYAEYLYPSFALLLLNSFSKKNRNEFLSITFSSRDYKKIRTIENLMVCTPFSLFLITQGEFINAAALFLLSFILSLINKGNDYSMVVPTPFSKHPFEFIIGFRKSFIGFALAYGLTAISISVENFNLGIFSLIVPFLISMNFYSQQEPLFYVWIHSSEPVQFLKNKMKWAILHSALLSTPIITALLFVFPDKILILLLAELTGILFVIMALLGKYASYPSQLNITLGFAVAFSIMFPPLTLLIIPYFYSKSLQNLQSHLAC